MEYRASTRQDADRQQDRRPAKEGDTGVRPGRNLSYLFFGLVIGTALLIFFVLFQRSFAPERYIAGLAISPLPPVEAEDFELNSLAGKRVTLDDFRGRVVFLNFWATWCQPCKVEMPLMQRLHQSLGAKGLSIVAVDLKDDEESVRRYVQELRLTFDVLLDPAGRVGEMYGVAQIPTTYLIDREGKFVGRVIGPRHWMSSQSLRLFDDLIER